MAATRPAAFDFGQVAIPLTATRTVYVLHNTNADNETMSARIEGSPVLRFEAGLSCDRKLASGGACAVAATFAPTTSGTTAARLILTLHTGWWQTRQQVISLRGQGVQLAAGASLITPTANPVVARYSYQPRAQGSVRIAFGVTAAYGTWTGAQSAPANRPVSILVAGMLQHTAYHMRAEEQTTDGSTEHDQDHVFTTSGFPANMLPRITAATTQGLTPQPGIDLVSAALSRTNPDYLPVYATDLQGRIVWGYSFPDRPTRSTIVQPIRMLPNGNFLVTISPGPLPNLKPADRSVDLIREIDLAGDPIRQITIPELNAQLAGLGKSLKLLDFHHELLPLPNGHFLLLATTIRKFKHPPGYSHKTDVVGDVMIDLDTNWRVAWVWNTFDHLDLAHHPTDFPEWTHTNAILYSANDGDLLISMRHQNWIIKIDYRNGQGSGRVLWKLGKDGDFRLVNGTAPQDWFYGQHQPALFSDSTAGTFKITMLDNGYERFLANGRRCGASSKIPCYSTVPVFSVDTNAMTATILSRKVLPTPNYSMFGGGTTVLSNGDLEYDLCSDPFGYGSMVEEMTQGPDPRTVWKMTETGSNLYRANRIPSLYPGVQW